MSRPFPRRRSPVIVILLAAALVAGCGDYEEPAATPAATPAPEAQPALRRFVGAVPEANGALMAVLVDEEAGVPRVRAYLCDSTRIFEWFRGSPTGSEISLSSSGGSTLKATLGSDVAGTVTLTDGRTVPFRAGPATGFADLFDVRGADDGSITGTSDAGARLTGRVDASRTQDGMHPASVTVTTAAGQELGLQVLVGKANVGRTRWIVSADGAIVQGTDVHPLPGVRGVPVRN